MHEVLVMRISIVDEDENTKCMAEPEAKEVLHTHVYIQGTFHKKYRTYGTFPERSHTLYGHHIRIPNKYRTYRTVLFKKNTGRTVLFLNIPICIRIYI